MNKFTFFTGPCVLESRDFSLEVASELQEIFRPFEDRSKFYFKGSFDKANRTSVTSFRGPGMNEGLKILEEVNKKTGLPVITDFHLPSQANDVASVVDVLQVPAFLSRQTDMIIEGAKACAKYGRILKIKKAQFLSPSDMRNVVQKAMEHLPKEKILLTERGTSFGYQNLVVDMRSFPMMKGLGVKCIHDATHCVQRPGAKGNLSGGDRPLVFALAKAAVAAGAEGIFMEAHPNPDKALSDPATALPMSELSVMIKSLLDLYKTVSALEVPNLGELPKGL